MRLAPVPMFFAHIPDIAILHSVESSKTTHRAQTCVDACRYVGGLLVGALTGVTKQEILAERYSPGWMWKRDPLVDEIDEIAVGSFKHREPPVIKGTGHVVKSLEAALWAFYKTDSFREGCLLAVNLGDDADTTGAVYGQIAGAFYGEEGIPKAWRDKLTHRALIESFADRLFHLSRRVKLNDDLENACVYGRWKDAKDLVYQGADADGNPEAWGYSPLIAAVEHGNVSVKFVKFLLGKGIDINRRNHLDESPLSIAVRTGQFKVATLLVRRGANPDTEDDPNNMTPLMYAVYDGRLRMTRFLLEHKADVNFMSSERITALWIARLYGRKQIVQVLLDHGADPRTIGL